jgi:uncharacterized membrane protein
MSARTHTRPDTPSGGRERRIISWRLLTTALLVGALAGAVAAVAVAPALSVPAGWSAAASVVLVRVWQVSWPQDADGTQRLAEQEGRTRATDTAVLASCVASLAAVVVALVRSSRQDAVAVAAVILGVLVAALSWALSNTVFALKYARIYYDGEEGGVDFKADRRPTYCDFAYLAFTVGMSFAVPETEPTSTRVRKVALGHALLSYLFGTVVVAVAVNLVTNLGSS